MRRTFCFSRSWRPYPTVFFIFLFLPCCPGMKLRFSMAHFSEKQRSPLRNSFIPSRRHSRQTGPMYLAITIVSAYQTLRFLGGLHPLWGMGVLSLIARTSRPAVARARMADSRPEPGPLTRTSTTRRPTSLAFEAAVMEACCAANGVPFRDPRKPSEPALDQEMVLPSGSAMVTMVLLKVACTCTVPLWTTRFSFFLKDFFLPALADFA